MRRCPHPMHGQTQKPACPASRRPVRSCSQICMYTCRRDQVVHQVDVNIPEAAAKRCIISWWCGRGAVTCLVLVTLGCAVGVPLRYLCQPCVSFSVPHTEAVHHPRQVEHAAGESAQHPRSETPSMRTEKAGGVGRCRLRVIQDLLQFRKCPHWRKLSPPSLRILKEVIPEHFTVHPYRPQNSTTFVHPWHIEDVMSACE